MSLFLLCALATLVLCWGWGTGNANTALGLLFLLTGFICGHAILLLCRSRKDRQALEYALEENRQARAGHIQALEQLTREARRQVEQTQKIIDSIPLPVYHLDAHHCFQGCNRAFEQLTGQTRDHILGRSALEIAPPEMASACREIGATLLARGGSHNFEGTLTFDPRHPRQVLCHKAALLDDNQTPMGLVATLVDITERKEMEQQLLLAIRGAEETSRLLQSLIDTAPAAIITLDLDGRVTRWNATAEKIFGWTQQEVLGQSCPLLPPDASQEEFLSVLAQGNELRGKSVTRRHRNGRAIHTLLSTSPIRNSSGELVGAMGIMEDITELKDAERSLQKAKEEAEAASRAKSQFVANISHELRTPMNGILGMTDLLADTPLNAEQREFLGMAQSSARSLLGLLNDILDIAKIEAGKLSLDEGEFALLPVIEGALAPLRLQARNKGLEFTLTLDPSLPPQIFGDEQRLRQILINLVSNAVKFTPSGAVGVEVEARPLGDGGKPGLLIRVSDTGIGIVEDQLERIFESFAQADGSHTRRFGGTGLGLAICRELVGMMRGRIRVQSTPGEGSVFHLHLPLVASRSATRPLPAQSGEIPGKAPGLRILLAEDNRINQQLARRILEKRGHQVRVVSDGQAALDALKRLPFDLVVMDVQMPVMNGVEATAAIREGEAGWKNRGIPIIALTAHAMEGEKERMLAAGMTAYHSKPLKATEFSALVESLAPAGAGG